MASLILLVVAAAWAAVLIPPLLRSRVENRPNSSVSDFRNQLSSLQRALPTRTVSMRGMARPLAPSPLARPAAAGRPVMRSGVKTHGAGTTRSAGQQAAVRAPEPARLADASLRRRAYEPGSRARHVASHQISDRDAMKRRRANVLFVLVLVTGCSVFLAVTTKTSSMTWVAGIAGMSLCAYLVVLAQARGRAAAAARPAERRRQPVARREHARDLDERREPARRERQPARRAALVAEPEPAPEELWGGGRQREHSPSRQREHGVSRQREHGVTRQREHGASDRRSAGRQRVAGRYSTAV